MKSLKGTVSLYAMILAIITALTTTIKTKATNKEIGKRIYYWIKYDCNPINPQPVFVSNNYRVSVNLQPPYSEIECMDEVSKCAVKFDISNTQSHPIFPNLLLPINPTLELQIIGCETSY